VDPKTEVFDWVRQDLGLRLTDDRASNADLDIIDSSRIMDLEFLELREVTPFTQRVIKRSRERLEEEGKLVRIEMTPFGDGQPILCSHSMEQAFELAADFAGTLKKRVKASGFIKTLIQRRVGSSLMAGLNTTRKMLRGGELAEEEDPHEDGASIYPLKDEEPALLKRLEEHLVRHLDREDDPKFERVRQVLSLEFEGKTWLERGVLIFSQFYDSAFALCEYLSRHLEDPIGLYANTSASKLFDGDGIHSIDRSILKEKVTQGRLQEITAIFGIIPDFIVDQWVKDMLDDREWDNNTVLKVIADRKDNPFTLKETTESLSADWDGTAEVLNQAVVMREFIGGW